MVNNTSNDERIDEALKQYSNHCILSAHSKRYISYNQKDKRNKKEKETIF